MRVSVHLSLLVSAFGVLNPPPPAAAAAAAAASNNLVNGHESDSTGAVPPFVGGDETCPCLPAEEIDVQSLVEEIDGLGTVLGDGVDLGAYGVGCAPHDANTSICSDANRDCTRIVPLPRDCDKSYCTRSFCYVDPNRCRLLNDPSSYFKGRLHYSYATCGEMDSFTYAERLRSLTGKTLSVAFNSNSGGWKGAYNPEGNFAANALWTGPIVDFVTEAALRAGFTVNITSPPEWLRPRSQLYIGNSSFDYCVYAASLGYVDLCVAAYTITEKRASVTTMYETTSDPIYLVVFREEEDGGGASMETFFTAVKTVFRPFTLGAWLMITLFCLPALGILMVLHEYGSPGSAYPEKERVLMMTCSSSDQDTKKEDVSGARSAQSTTIRTVRVPLWRHMAAATYRSFLAFLEGSLGQSVVTVSGRIHLLAVAAFVMLILAVYTANLAAILTQDIQRGTVDSVDAALRAGYNFCASRKMAELAIKLNGVPPSRIVPDPVDSGGDGMPGFNCPDCNARTRVFEYMRAHHGDPSTYCNAAIASLEDVQVLHKYGEHCNKAHVGGPLGYRAVGVPISPLVDDAMVSLFHQMKVDGRMNAYLNAAEPDSRCPANEGEGESLSTQQLTGIWVVTFSIAIAGLVARGSEMLLARRRQRQRRSSSSSSSRRLLLCRGLGRRQRGGRTEQRLRMYDQWGPLDEMELPDSDDADGGKEDLFLEQIDAKHSGDMKRSSSSSSTDDCVREV